MTQLFALPDHETLYAALLARDPAWEGQVWACISSTGIFCRLTCPARKPLAQNTSFESSIGACIAAGFRPCKRCQPLGAAAAAEPAVAALLGALEAEPGRRWSEGDVTRMGFDASTVRRVFRRQFGMTFLEMARQKRLRESFEVLGEERRVIEAQLAAGFESPGAFREAFARLLGVAPGRLVKGGILQAGWIPTPLGDMIAVSSPTHLHLLEFTGRKALPGELQRLAAGGEIGIGRPGPTEQVARELETYFAGKGAEFTVPLSPLGTPFQREVWAALRRIPAGETRSYGQLAEGLGNPGAVRAVAQANGANPIALVIPCHRVIGADGRLTGYGGGLWRKDRLIALERLYAAG